MSARAALRLGAASVLAASLALAAAPSAGIAAPTEGCSWQRHSKPILKRVRRHGRLRPVRRVKHWWTCEAPPSTLMPQPALPLPPTSQAPPAEEAEPQIDHLGVKAVEYSYTLSRPEVSAGEVIVELNNQGEDPHNLKLEREGSEDPQLEVPTTASAAQTSSRFTLFPGTYRLYCSLYKHEAKGMEATLVVSD